MANCDMAVKVVEVKNYVLSLSEQEAGALLDILANVGGDPEYSNRKYVDSMYEALLRAKVKSLNSQFEDSKRSLHFKDN